jgi:hypothetical protein
MFADFHRARAVLVTITAQENLSKNRAPLGYFCQGAEGDGQVKRLLSQNRELRKNGIPANNIAHFKKKQGQNTFSQLEQR